MKTHPRKNHLKTRHQRRLLLQRRPTVRRLQPKLLPRRRARLRKNLTNLKRILMKTLMQNLKRIPMKTLMRNLLRKRHQRRPPKPMVAKTLRSPRKANHLTSLPRRTLRMKTNPPKKRKRKKKKPNPPLARNVRKSLPPPPRPPTNAPNPNPRAQ